MSGVITTRRPAVSSIASPARCRRKFLRHFPRGFADETYLSFERDYKYHAHEQWETELGHDKFRALLRDGSHSEVAARAVRIESRTNLLFSFEKMAIRDAVKSAPGAKAFSTALYDFLHAEGPPERKFNDWCNAVANLPRRQTRVLTWPLLTVFGFIAQPRRHIFLKPIVTRLAADAYGFPFQYQSRPNYATYDSLLAFARTIRRDLRDLRPRDMIDLQSFIWVLGSDEYPD
jgi:hypothetical protein